MYFTHDQFITKFGSLILNEISLLLTNEYVNVKCLISYNFDS